MKKTAGVKRYVAFLRAVNVGGHASLKMDDLRKMFEAYDLQNVQTYIQSGNVIFETKESADLEAKITQQLERDLSYRVEVFLRTLAGVARIVEKKPFEPQGNETLHIVFLHKKPDKIVEQELMTCKSKADDFVVKGCEIYNLRHDRDKSVFSNNFIEKIVKAPATTRNLTTVGKIVEKYQ